MYLKSIVASKVLCNPALVVLHCSFASSIKRHSSNPGPDLQEA